MPRSMDVSAVLHNHESDQVDQTGLSRHDSVEDLPVDIIIPVSQLKVLQVTLHPQWTFYWRSKQAIQVLGCDSDSDTLTW